MLLELLTVARYEVGRFVRSELFYVLLLAGVVPTLVFLALSAEKALLEALLTDLEAVQETLVLGFVFFTYIVGILVAVMATTDLVNNDPSLEFLVLVTSRWSLFLGKLIALGVILLFFVVESQLAFIFILFIYQVPLPPPELLLVAFTVTYLLVLLVPAGFSLLSSSFALRFGFSSSLASYLVIFSFFIAPFVVYFSFFELGLFQLEMLDYVLHSYVQPIVLSVVVGREGGTTASLNSSYLVVGQFSVLSYLGAVVLFVTAPARRS